MKENNRSSIIFGSMNSMFFIENNKDPENRLFSIEDGHKPNSLIDI
jgi:hypothetical protein